MRFRLILILFFLSVVSAVAGVIPGFEPVWEEPGPVVKPNDSITEEVLTEEELVHRKDSITEDLDEAKTWSDALLLINQYKYDEAIEILKTMLDSTYASKAGAKIAEVSLLSASAERRKAADLFVRFSKTTNVESQKKILVASRTILLGILLKYPDVGLTEKVMGNINIVEKEMNAIDPDLIHQTDLRGKQ